MNCRRFARHIAQETLPLHGWRDHCNFCVHVVVCPFCRRYWREIRALGKVHRANSAFAQHPAVKLFEVKSRIKDEMKRRAA